MIWNLKEGRLEVKLPTVWQRDAGKQWLRGSLAKGPPICTQLWREARLEVKTVKTDGLADFFSDV